MTKEELTKENAIFLLKQVNEILINNNSWLESTHEPLNQAFDMAIKALEQQSSDDDCVSRKAVDLLCFKYLKPNTDDNIAFYEHFCDLPPVTITRKQSEWYLRGGKFTCKNCEERALLKLTDATGGCKEYNYYTSNFCPNCGAEMKGAEDGEND